MKAGKWEIRDSFHIEEFETRALRPDKDLGGNAFVCFRKYRVSGVAKRLGKAISDRWGVILAHRETLW